MDRTHDLVTAGLVGGEADLALAEKDGEALHDQRAAKAQGP
jgi:hypothetical protein